MKEGDRLSDPGCRRRLRLAEGNPEKIRRQLADHLYSLAEKPFQRLKQDDRARL